MSIAILVAVGALPACWTPARYSAWRLDDFRRNALGRAAFELDCPATGLAVIDLAPQLEGLGGDVGVTGCGRRAVYVLRYGSGWVNNTGYEDQGSARGRVEPPAPSR